MSQVLHITNGDSGVVVIQNAGFEGVFLPWQDVLHLGPVLPAKTLQRFDPIRIQFLSDFYGLPTEKVEADFKRRRQLWDQASDHQAVYLWFEHDLYDQLQLCQVLYLLSQASERSALFYLIQTDHYIGESSQQDIKEAHSRKVAIDEQQLNDATKVWHAVTQSTPEALLECLQGEALSLKYMQTAVERLLSELPHPASGLSLSQQRMLTPLIEKDRKQSELFREMQQLEPHQFMGDTTFHQLLQAMMLCQVPLVTASHDENPWSRMWSLTRVGHEVLKGEQNHIRLNGINHWVGGCHLKPSHIWCYDNQSKSLRGPYEVSN